MDKNTFKNILGKYLPENAVEAVYHLIVDHHVFLTITRQRKSKLGDFRPSANGKPQRISINHNLNKYAFLITFLHELAHQLTWEKYKTKVAPHGIEWKQAFADLLHPFVERGSFPDEIAQEITKHPDKHLYATLADTKLARQLKKHDEASGLVLLESLADNTHFMLPDGRKFIKQNKRRKNYQCMHLSSRRLYAFNPLAEVIPLDDK